MKLDRTNGRGKYAIVNLREIERIGGIAHGHNPDIAHALRILETNDLIEYGEVGTENEFFVIKLKDRYARCALHAYADEARRDQNTEYSDDVTEMALRSGTHHPHCKRPD